MHCSPYMLEDRVPSLPIPETVFQHFLDTKYYDEDLEYLDLYERKELLNAIISNEEFSKFWTQIQEHHPEKKEYFLSLLNEEEPYDYGWIQDEYDAYHKQGAFESLSVEEREKLQTEFDELRPAEYQLALKGEAKRLNCDIADVIPISPVLSWKLNHDEESMLARLPDGLFARVFQLLDALDIFKMTLVCTRWRRLIHDNCVEMKKAEHAMTTHLIRFTEWMNPPKTPRSHTFLRQYQMFSWSLTRWYCGVAKNLETLILDHPIPYNNVSELLHACPNLKHLRFVYDASESISSIVTRVARVQLPNLEVFISSCMAYRDDGNRPCRHLYRDVLGSSPFLRVFTGALDSDDIVAIVARNPMNNAFSTLIALDLTLFAASTLETLAQIDGLQLRYLSLGCHLDNSKVDGISVEEQLRNALHQLLPRLSKLEMLRTSDYLGVTNETIQLMTDLKLNINWVVLFHSYFMTLTEADDDIIVRASERDPIQPDVLLDFQDMLLSKNPGIDLSQIQFVVLGRETRNTLEALDTGFTFLSRLEKGYDASSSLGLYNPRVKRYLGIDF